jgi:uncharacterized protein
VSDGRLQGRRALVTGASSGIGRALARELAGRGCDLVVVARRRDRLEALAEALREDPGVEVVVVEADLCDPEAPSVVFERTEGAGLPVDVLVNNAGLGTYDDFLEVSWESIETQLAVNVRAVARMCHLFAPAMVARGRGNIMNVASIAAYVPTPGYSIYASTKAFVRHMSEILDYELRGTGVRVICINPGATQTEFMDRADQVVLDSGRRLMMPAERCARISIDKMLAGRRNVITGWTNALGMWLLRFLPRAWAPGLAKMAMETAVKKKRSG